MPSLKSLRNRIASVKATQKITKAMQMVAASKLRRAQAAAEAARPYATAWRRSCRTSPIPSATPPARRNSSPAPDATGRTSSSSARADRGLCGAFNSSIARLARDHALRLQGEGKEVKFLCVGRKGFDILRRIFPKQIVEVVELRGIKQIGFANADAIGQKVLALFAAGAFDVCTLFFAEFRSVISQIPTTRQLIPAQITAPAEVQPGSGNAIYEYEPDEESILADLLPRNLSIQIFRALSKTSPPSRAPR